MVNCIYFLRLSRIMTERQLTCCQQIVKWTVFSFFLAQFIAPQLVYMKTRATNIVEMATITYAILTIFGTAVQFVMLNAKAELVQQFVLKLERFVNTSI